MLTMMLTACSSTSSDSSEPPPDLLERSSNVMGSLQFASYTMERSGAPITVQGLEFNSADGVYAAPASASAVLDVAVSGITVRVATISVDDRTWLTNPVTGAWEELDPGTGFNPALVFDSEIGWQRLLSEDLSDVSVDGTDGAVWLVSATVAGERVDVLTAGLAGGDAIPIELEIDRESSHLVSVRFTTVGAEGSSDWVIELSDFDQPVTIEQPAP